MTLLGAGPVEKDRMGRMVAPMCLALVLAGLSIGTVDAAEPPKQCVDNSPVEEVAGPKGLIAGRVHDVQRKRPIANARVYVRGSSASAASDRAGRFRVMVAAGKRDLVVIRPGYATARIEALAVPEAGEVTVTVALAPAGVALDDFVIAAPRIVGGTVELLAERKNSGAVSDIIGAEQMSRSGDGDAAGALKRVTGVSIVGGRYVYVRGLGERYSSTSLDGSSLPSPDPERRVVPLDLFPTGMLSGIVIQKTWSPDRPGGFGGGSVQLRTRAFPKGLVASAGFSVGFRLGTTFTEGLTGARGGTDWLGLDGGHRALPASVDNASRNAPLLKRDMFSSRGYTGAELEAFGEAAAGDWAIGKRIAPPDVGFSATLGKPMSLLGGDGGWLASVSYGNNWQQKARKMRIFTVGEGGNLELAHRYNFEELNNTVSLGGFLTAGLAWKSGHELRTTAVVARLSDDEARIYEGENRDVATDIRVSWLRWVERMLAGQILSGTHPLPWLKDGEFTWRYALFAATRGEPDRRQVRYDLDQVSGEWFLSDRPEGNRRVFSDLTDVNHDLGLNVGWTLARRHGKPVHLDVGTAGRLKSRHVDTRRYKFLHKGPRSNDDAVLRLEPDRIFTPANIGKDGFQFEETTLETDNYDGAERMIGVYAKAGMLLTKKLRVEGGLRFEHSNQAMQTYEPFNADHEPVTSALTTNDVLPGASLTYTLREAMLVRFAVARTVSRPDLRELSPATFNEVTGGRQLFGNPQLQRTLIDHVDARWEFFIGEGEVLSAGLFFKRFQQPIETIVVPSAQLSVTFANADAAHNLGIELEARKHLGWLHKGLSDIFVSANGALISSTVTLPSDGSTIQTSKDRPLQGQSPWLVNFQVGWDDVDFGHSVTLLYNAFGPRIAEVGALGAPDVYEQAVHQLDAVVKINAGHGFKLGLKARNLLDPAVERRQGNEVTQTWRRGRVFGVSLSRAWR